MSETAITESVLSAGQNEGVERSILPLPQLAFVQNARQRKSGRWGKRFGSEFVANTSGLTIGNGEGNCRAIGPGFCVVDDQCAVFERQSALWADPRSTVASYAIASAFVQNPRIPGAISGWLPSSSYYPVPSASAQAQTIGACSSAFCLGYLWSAVEYEDPAIPGQSMLRVTAVNPVDSALAFLVDIRDVAASTRYPRLVACGATLVLVYVDGTTIVARNLTTLAGGFSAPTVLETGFHLTDASAPGAQIGFDATAMTVSNTLFLLATSLVATINLKVVTASTLGVFASAALTPFTATGGGATVATSVSIVGDTIGGGGRAWVTYGSFSTVGLAHETKIAAYDANTATLIATALLTNQSYVPAYATILPGQKVRVVFGYGQGFLGVDDQRFSFADVSAAGVLVSSIAFTQYRYKPVSRPFSIGSRAYVWAATNDVQEDHGTGYATLLRLPADTEVGPTSGFTTGTINCPLEMSAQDFLVSSAVDQLGIPPVAHLGTSASYQVLIPTLANASDTVHDFRAIQATHYTDVQSARGVQSVAYDGANFLPLGVCTRVDARGATEAGFALLATTFDPVPAAGGALTAASTYFYTAVYVAKNTNGRTEISGPSAPTKATLAGGQTKVTINIGMLEIGARAMCQIQIYRTLSNGTVFYLLDTIDGSEGSGSANFQTYVDVIADTTISSHQEIYTQLGQTLPNAFPPPSRFAVTGGQRVWLGGLLRGDVVHCSKLVLGDQSPTWADHDAFRVVLPANVTGLAWMDNLLIFTTEGVYIVSGDGPDDSGSGSFSPPIRLPFAFGCIEPRSVITTDDGTFFQTARGLYMVPRGFGASVPAGDMVMDSLQNYPVITGTAALIKPTEQTIRWSCMDPATNQGQQIVYDLVHKCWSIDFLTDPTLSSDTAGMCALGSWFNGEVAYLHSREPASPIPLVSNSLFSDSGNPIAMALQTGDLRPFGVMSEGVMSKIYTLVQVQSLCELDVTKTTEWGTSPPAARVFAGAAGDAQVGDISYVETDLGLAELRDAVSLSITWRESSALDEGITGEGLAFIAIAIEHEQSEGLKRVSPLSRAT